MTLRTLHLSSQCRFARLASPDCIFMGSGGCTVLEQGLSHPLIFSSNKLKVHELAAQAKRFSSTNLTEVRGPSNRVLTLPKKAVGFSRASFELVPANAIKVSTPMYPMTLAATLGVCIAVIGTRTEADAGTFTILAHLLPVGHVDRDIKPVCEGSHCVSEQFMRWAAAANLGDDAQRKEVFLRSMLSIFSGGGWNMTIVTPLVGNGDAPHWISHVDVERHLVQSLGYDKDAITQEISRDIRLEPNGKIVIENRIR